MTDIKEFQEIAHSGGQLIIRVGADKAGRRGYQFTWQNSRPVAAGIFAVYAIPQGIAVGQMSLGGIGSVPNPPPIPGCFQVFIGSDSEGKYGHECPACTFYWRSNAGPQFCPYCGIRAETHHFITKAQRNYVAQVCAKMSNVLEEDKDGEYVIDMDAVADAVGQSENKPPFYYAEEAQQNKFSCDACGSFNDIRGRFCYCSVCGTRNDVQELSDKIVPALRNRINSESAFETCAKDAVAAFDTLVGQYVEQLLRHTPLTTSRRNRLVQRRFHNLGAVAVDLKEIFDIDILRGLDSADVEFAKLMFHRRHVYEHRGGEADEKYIEESGDKTVRPKQALRESQETAHRITGLILKMANNLHQGFHDIFPPDNGPIQQHQRYKPQKLNSPQQRPSTPRSSGA